MRRLKNRLESSAIAGEGNMRKAKRRQRSKARTMPAAGILCTMVLLLASPAAFAEEPWRHPDSNGHCPFGFRLIPQRILFKMGHLDAPPQGMCLSNRYAAIEGANGEIDWAHGLKPPPLRSQPRYAEPFGGNGPFGRGPYGTSMQNFLSKGGTRPFRQGLPPCTKVEKMLLAGLGVLGTGAGMVPYPASRAAGSGILLIAALGWFGCEWREE